MTATAPETIEVVATTWDELPSLVGREFVGTWFSPTPERTKAFDEVTYVNDNDHELDGGNFPDGILEGFYSLALMDHLVNQVFYVEDPRWSGWNYGLDHVRFVSPITTNDRFRVRGTVAEIIAKDDDYLVVMDCKYEVEGRERPGMVARWRVLWTLEDDGEAGA